MSAHKSRQDAATDVPNALRRRFTKFVINWHSDRRKLKGIRQEVNVPIHCFKKPHRKW